MLTTKQRYQVDILMQRRPRKRRVVDLRDNTILGSTRELAGATGLSQPTISRLLNALKNEGILKEVEMFGGRVRRMIDPMFVWKGHYLDKAFAKGCFALGSFDAAIEWRDMCVELDRYIDPYTGELFSRLNATTFRITATPDIKGSRLTLALTA